MILDPAIIALLAGSLLTSCMLLYAACFAVRILRHWDLASGSEVQIALERRTYLLATIMICVMIFQLFSLFLFITTADRLCTLFSGAMCAAGTLNLNRFGYPALLLNLAGFLLAGTWLIVNHADNQGFDYPLIRVKYRLLLLTTPVLLLETALQAAFFLSLHPHVITSCCGSLFGNTARNLAPSLSLIPEVSVLVALTTVTGVTFLAGGRYLRHQRGAYGFAAAATAMLATGAVGMVSAIPVYLYELPSHHCPFCMLHREYHYVGFALYLTLLCGGVAGMGVGVLRRCGSGQPGSCSAAHSAPSCGCCPGPVRSVRRDSCLDSHTIAASAAVGVLQPVLLQVDFFRYARFVLDYQGYLLPVHEFVQASFPDQLVDFLCHILHLPVGIVVHLQVNRAGFGAGKFDRLVDDLAGSIDLHLPIQRFHVFGIDTDAAMTVEAVNGCGKVGSMDENAGNGGAEREITKGIHRPGRHFPFHLFPPDCHLVPDR